MPHDRADGHDSRKTELAVGQAKPFRARSFIRAQVEDCVNQYIKQSRRVYIIQGCTAQPKLRYKSSSKHFASLQTAQTPAVLQTQAQSSLVR